MEFCFLSLLSVIFQLFDYFQVFIFYSAISLFLDLMV
jgi:hypothetical protein